VRKIKYGIQFIFNRLFSNKIKLKMFKLFLITLIPNLIYCLPVKNNACNNDPNLNVIYY
jgi:hypothetical protein